ncbi:MAG: FtsQ-type POTRA domain-containing protein [Acidobacteria bacterium]|nr:FtsQ-type POTRA domain-containing protein [Acidobacteriota bacterium]
MSTALLRPTERDAAASDRTTAEPVTVERPLRPGTPGHPHRVPGPSSFDERLVPRFRRRRVAPGQRRQRRLLGVLRAFSLLVAAVGMPLALVVWLFTAPQLSFRTLDVRTAPEVPQSWIEAQLAPLEGKSLLLLSLSEVETRIESHPWVAGVAIRKRLPDALEVEVVVRRPVAVLEREGRRLLVDADGRPIAEDRGDGATTGGDLLLLGGACDSKADVRRALGVAEQVRTAPSAAVGRLTAVEVLGDDDFRLHVDGLPYPLVVRASGAADEIASFERLLPDVRAHFERLRSVDLRFSRKIVLQPEPEESASASRTAPSRG